MAQIGGEQTVTGVSECNTVLSPHGSSSRKLRSGGLWSYRGYAAVVSFMWGGLQCLRAKVLGPTEPSYQLESHQHLHCCLSFADRVLDRTPSGPQPL